MRKQLSLPKVTKRKEQSYVRSGLRTLKAAMIRVCRQRPMVKGWPDYYVLSSEGRDCFIEFKREGEGLRDDQALIAQELVRRGKRVYVVTSAASLKPVLNWLLTGKKA